ncbi:MAG: hypothetical protein NTW19_13140 [Planctomycetota bacterium]|nr:hypothetical protein [Planctomycetota bacterium]
MLGFVRFCRSTVVLLALASGLASGLDGQTAQAQPRPAGAKGLPQEHEYQKQLRAYLATLTAKDFDASSNQRLSPATGVDLDDQFRNWVLAIDAVRVGNKRCPPSVNLPANQYTLSFIESPTDQTIIQPNAWPEPQAWLANWKMPGNPFYGSKALKLRAFVLAVEDMLMVDEQQEHTNAPMWRRSDWFAPHFLMYAYTYAGVKDVLPEAPRKAYEEGLKKMVQRVVKWGPRGDETYLDIQAAVAMTILFQSMDDAELKPAMEAYVKLFMAPGEFYNPAGYFADQGCFDTGFNGLNLYYATWLAARAPAEWKWARESVAQAWKLRGYLMLPEPDDDVTLSARRHILSPTHMTLRTGSSVYFDQWDWAFKFVTAAYLTDDAVCQMTVPTAQNIKDGPSAGAGGINGQLDQNPQDPRPGVAHNVFLKTEELGILPTAPWVWRFYPGSPVFPMVNYGAEHYPKGFAAHLAELTAKNSPLLKLPFERSGAFIEQFDKGFLVAKSGGYGAIIHTAPVSEISGKEVFEWPNAPYGLSGGTLSAFWTPATGSAVLGRRGGMSNTGGQAVNFDKPEEWRTWPVHAVIGANGGAAGAEKFFTSARILKPESIYEVKGDHATVKVSGLIPAAPLGKEKSLEGKLEYARTFSVAPDGVRVETSVKGDGVDKVTELYEAIPAFHREGGIQPETVVAKIEFQSGGAWAVATPAYVEKVTAVRITRFNGAAVITFDRPRRVKLSPAETGPGFLTGGVSRNILVDLLESGGQPAAIKEARTVTWTIAPAAK